MSEQDIYDNDSFFDGYRKLRENTDSANNREEKPAIFAELPCVKGKSILDLGCGYGENCKTFSEMGAKSVAGVDISRKMLQIAEKENRAANIQYYNLPMEDIKSIGGKFDIAVSSLAIHYVKDFNALAKDVSFLLNDGGVFLFSQEHPLTTAPIAGAKWVKDDAGKIDHYRLADYARTGERSVSWIVDGVIKYHRTFSDLVNGLVAAGFHIEKMEEPVPTPETIQRLPYCAKCMHKPNFLIIKAGKQS
jgi:SAM-dependent methyltransferase